MPSVSIAKGNPNRISNIPMVDGQILIDTENNYMYLDTIGSNNKIKRVLMGSQTEITPAEHYTITYNGNGNTGGNTESQTKTENIDIELRSNGFLKTGYVFKEWNTASNGSGTSYYEGDVYVTNADLTLYAIWELPVVQYTISYNGNGATSGSTESQTKDAGVSVTIRSNGFTKTNYVFVEWNTSSDGSGTSYDAGDTYSADANLTLYAIWEEQLIPPNSVVVAFENENDSNLDIIILSESSMDGATSVTYAGNTYYYIEKQNQDPNDYAQYNLNLYETNTYYGHDAASRGELAYIIFDGEIEENYNFIHNSSQYITGAFTQPIITAEDEISFRYYSNLDWETTPRGYHEVSLTVTNKTSPVYFVSVALQNHDFVAISENPFTYHIVNVQYAADGSYLYKNEFNWTGSAITRNDITYYAVDFNVGSYGYLDNCSLERTFVTTTTWSNDQKWELAFIVFDGTISSSVTIASHFTDSNITGIWVQPIIINIIEGNSPILLGNTRMRTLSTPSLRTNNSLVDSIVIKNNEGSIQIYNPFDNAWQNLYNLVSFEQIIEVENGDVPIFTFDTTSVNFPQRAEIFTNVYGLKPDAITYDSTTMTIRFPTFDISTYGDIEALTCKVYFN